MANYTSLFKVDGKPILPPLMTLEKRFEMQMYREKAIQLERNFTDERQRKKVQFCEVTPPEAFDLDCVISDSASARSTDLDENMKNPSEISTSLPSSPASTIVREKEMIDFGTNTQSCGSENDTKSRMMKLRKSETICFDVNEQTIIGTLTKEQMEKFRLNNENKETKKLTKEEKARIRLINANKESNGEIQKLLHSLIPSICINPPTPMSVQKNILDTLSGSESVDSCTHSGFQSSQATENPVLNISDDGSTGESIENTISSTQRRSTASAARMLDFEQTQKEELACEDVEDSPELNINSRSPQRSATSPSLKSLSDTNGTCSLTTSPHRADDMSRQSLVRSSSFTLEKPSKVLMDHMGQQNRQVTNEENESSKRSPTASRRTTIISQRSPQTPPSAWRDTVESKAKRVQKKIDTKPKPSAARSKSKAVFHNYATNAKQILTKTPPPLKIKRSPYDPKVKLTQNNKSQMSSRNPKSNTVRKSSSSTTYTVQPTVRVPVPTINKALTENDNIMNDIDKQHREKLLLLITQQQEEQRRLQHAFESQQRMLLEQLNNEKYNHLPIAPDISGPPLQMEGVAGCPARLNAEKALNFNNENAASPFDCSTVTNSIISPGMRDVLGGFASNANCELPFKFPLKPNSLDLASSAVEVPPLNYTNNGKFCEKFGSAMENKQHFTFRKE